MVSRLLIPGKRIGPAWAPVQPASLERNLNVNKYLLRTAVGNIHEDKAVLAVVGPEARDVVVETSREVVALGAAAIEGEAASSEARVSADAANVIHYEGDAVSTRK
jgi:hypothetical protein